MEPLVVSNMRSSVTRDRADHACWKVRVRPMHVLHTLVRQSSVCTWWFAVLLDNVFQVAQVRVTCCSSQVVVSGGDAVHLPVGHSSIGVFTENVCVPLFVHTCLAHLSCVTNKLCTCNPVTIVSSDDFQVYFSGRRFVSFVHLGTEEAVGGQELGHTLLFAQSTERVISVQDAEIS